MTPSRRSGPAEPSALTLRECSGLTTRLILVYVEREGGSEAVRRLLEDAALADHEAELRDENAWLPDEFRRRLFDAAVDVLGDPLAAQRIGASALELNTGQSLKLALRALGSPRLLYSNVVRANAKFNRVHQMELLELSDDHASITNAPTPGTPYHPSDCRYNLGLLSCAPLLWGEPAARVSHPRCIADGDDICVYEVRWTTPERRLRRLLGWGAGAVAAVGGAAILVPPAAPFAATAALGAGLYRVAGRGTRRRRLLESEVQEERDATELLMGSLHDLVSALRLEDVLEKITTNARAAVGGTEFALLLEEPGGLRCQGSPGLPPEMIDDLKSWASASRRPFEGAPFVIDDLDSVAELAALREHPELRAGSLCAAPLIGRDGSVGTLVAIARVRQGFLPRDVELVRSYASQAAIAISNARLYEAQEALASRDPLTGLFNHREFHERLSRELERCRRYGCEVSIVMLDLDDFKLVNDTGGHAEGDRVLRRVAEALQGLCRGSDLAFRIGGDELAVVLPETGTEQATAIARRLSAALGVVDRRVGVSCGVASWPESGPSKDTLLAHADRELYANKQRRTGVPGPGSDRLLDPRSPAGADTNGLHTPAGHRLAAARRLAGKLARVLQPDEIARVAACELHRALGEATCFVAKLEGDDTVRLVIGAGSMYDQLSDPTSWRQGLGEGVVGRTARTGEPALVAETRRDPDFIFSAETIEPRSELAVAIRVRGEVWGVLNVEHAEPHSLDVEDLEFTDMIAAQVGAAIHRGLLFEELEETFMATIAVLSDALEATDAYTAEHARGVAELAEGVGERLGLDRMELRDLRYAALLHDIGKIAVPPQILTEPGPLDAAELAVMRRHAAAGAEMLEQIPFFSSVHPLVRATHERWDGGGYPDGLRAEEIPLGARIIAACDALHAMTSHRPYRTAMSLEAAVDELELHSGTQFDREVVQTLLELVREREADPRLVLPTAHS